LAAMTWVASLCFNGKIYSPCYINKTDEKGEKYNEQLHSGVTL